MASKKKDILYWLGTPKEPSWVGTMPPLASLGDPDLDALREDYYEKMKELRKLRVFIRGTPIGVSMPQYTVFDYFENPKVLDCYLYIDQWKWESMQAKERRRQEAEDAEMIQRYNLKK